MNCPECAAETVTTTWETQVIPYGNEGDEISAVVPVRHCGRCQAEWLDWEAEEIREQAVSDFRERQRH